MKNNLKFLAILAIAACTAGPVLAGGDHHHDHAPKNGGIVLETKAGDWEIVAKPELLQIYISDHGIPFQLKGATAKITLLNGTEKSEAELLPSGDKMQATGSFKVGKGTKGIAVLTLAGKPPATARFEVK